MYCTGGRFFFLKSLCNSFLTYVLFVFFFFLSSSPGHFVFVYIKKDSLSTHVYTPNDYGAEKYTISSKQTVELLRVVTTKKHEETRHNELDRYNVTVRMIETPINVRRILMVVSYPVSKQQLLMSRMRFLR